MFLDVCEMQREASMYEEILHSEVSGDSRLAFETLLTDA